MAQSICKHAGGARQQCRELERTGDCGRAPRPAGTMSENTQRGCGTGLMQPGNSGVKSCHDAAMAASHSLLVPRKRARLSPIEHLLPKGT